MSSNLLKTTFGLLVTTIVLCLAGIAFGGNDADDSHENARDPIVGTWNCVVPANSSPCLAPGCFNVIKNFHAGGTMTEMDNLAPPSQESVVLGDWKRTGKHENRTYTANLEQFDFAGGSFQGTFHYVTPITLDRSLDRLTGSFHATEVDPFGNVTDLGSGTFSCTRNAAP